MADATHIEWTDATWNPITGCSVVSPGCTHCYAMQLAGTRLQHHPSRKGLTDDSKAGPVWNGQVRFNAEWLGQPLRWKRPRKIFVCAHGDLFHESVPDAWIDQVFAVMALSPQHVFQVLTKRPERMREYVKTHEAEIARLGDMWAGAMERRAPELRTEGEWGESVMDAPRVVGFQTWPLPNVWLGVSAEDQTRADERIPILLDTPAAVRWVSLEPLLGSVWLRHTSADRKHYHDWLTGDVGTMYADGPDFDLGPKLDWVVLGGESGPKARPMHPDWARRVRDDCAAAGVPFLFKQWGAWAPGEACPNLKARDTASLFNGAWEYDRAPAARGDEHIDDEPDLYRIGKKAAGRLLDGQLHDGYPPTHSSPFGGGGPSPQAMVEGVTHPASNGAPDHG